MILSHQSLVKWAKENCKPFDLKYVNPASIDLRLDNTIRIPKFDLLPWYRKIYHRFFPSVIVSKSTDSNQVWSEEDTFTDYILYSGRLALFSSLEITRIPDNLSAILMLKSSIGRMGLEHLHAGFGDPGFNGQWTFELYNASRYPIKLSAGETYVQLALSMLDETTDLSYQKTGKYNNQFGATPNRV